MHVFKFLFIVVSLHLSEGILERDLLLTPKEGLQIHGKRIFYRPGSNETSGIIPWEQTLKHVTYLTLFKNGEGDAKISDFGKYKKFMRSAYTRIHGDYPKFGDIITMAQGWLEKTNEYRFVEGVCDHYCSESALALWRVQKIRHRDLQRGFRYEMKFSVTPLKGSSAKQNRILNGEYLKSFILKDDDYPESFNDLTRRSDFDGIFSNERQARIVNEHPDMSLLNIGEYFKNIPRASSKVGYSSGTYDVHPTTYRPNYHIKFPKPETYEPSPEISKTVVTHHFHHHFFMNEPETRIAHEQATFLGNPDAIHVIEAPKPDILASQYARLYTTTPPPSILSYMHTTPIFKQTSYQGDPSAQLQLIPFKKSEEHIEKIRYSDPDPLYENEGLASMNINSETASAEVHSQVERPHTTADPQIITLDLSQVVVPKVIVVEESDEMITTQATPRLTETNHLNVTTTEKPRGYVSKVSINKFRTYPRSSTEQPILRWKPKRKLTEKKSEQQTNESTPVEVVTVTPSNVYEKDYEVLTKKSVSKSVSVKVGNYSQDLVVTSTENSNA